MQLHRAEHAGGWRPWRSQQGFHQTPRFRCVEHDSSVGLESFHGGLPDLREHKPADRLPSDRCGLGNQTPILIRNSRDESVHLGKTSGFFGGEHGCNVVHSGIQSKLLFGEQGAPTGKIAGLTGIHH